MVRKSLDMSWATSPPLFRGQYQLLTAFCGKIVLTLHCLLLLLVSGYMHVPYITNRCSPNSRRKFSYKLESFRIRSKKGKEIYIVGKEGKSGWWKKVFYFAVERGFVELRKLGIEQQLWEASRREIIMDHTSSGAASAASNRKPMTEIEVSPWSSNVRPKLLFAVFSSSSHLSHLSSALAVLFHLLWEIDRE